MPVPHLIVVSPRGSGTPMLARLITALGYTPYGTMSGTEPTGDGDRPGPGEVYPVLEAAYGQERATGLLRESREDLRSAFHAAVNALWRVWWRRLGQPVTTASPVDPALENRLSRLPDADLPRLLPGRGCWYVNSLDLRRADGGFLRSWQAGEQPPVIFHHRDVRDRIISQIHTLSQPADRVGSLPEHLIYRDILAALPTLDARIRHALTDPDFPGLEETRRCRWLAHHPAVCVVPHEDLAGPAEARARVLARLRVVTGHPVATLPAPLSGDGGGTDGDGADGEGTDGELAVGAWRRYFTPDHERLLSSRHPDLLAATVTG